jgi:membrane associated rhomboid family serine protease
VLLVVTVAIYALQILSGGVLTEYLSFNPYFSTIQPWRFITAGFVHSDSLFSNPLSVLHIVLNMYTLFLFGRALEPILGRWRFLALYLISIVGGSIAVMWLASTNTWVVGASGGAFGLMAAFLVILRSIGANSTTMAGVIAINLVFTFMNPSISWEAHVGGLALGAVVALLYSKTRDLKQQKLQVLGLTGIVLALAVAGGIRAFMILAEYGLL